MSFFFWLWKKLPDPVVAIEQNKDPERGRVVDQDILIDTHEGASLTMRKIIDMGEKIKKYLDGDIFFVFANKKENDVVFIKGNEKTKGGYIEKATFIQIKEQGKGIDPSKITKEFMNKIIRYVPKTLVWTKK